MAVICDTDILSVFAKAKKLELLPKAFPNEEFLISESVYDELIVSKEEGFDFPERIFEHCEITSLKENEIKQYKKKKKNSKYFPLSKADLRSLILAKEREIPLLSNDSHLLKMADEEDIIALDIYDIFKIIYREKILPKKKIKSILSKMEEKDNAIFKDKEEIFQK